MQYRINTSQTLSNHQILSGIAPTCIEQQNHILNGIDVSVYNGSVDFKKVKQFGIDFVMIREGYGSDGLYSKQVDANFERNYANAKKAGLYVGAYHYLYATTAHDAIQEAKGFLTHLKGKQFDMPIALDIEEEKQAQLPVSTVDGIVKAFMNQCEKAGYFCVLYSYESFLTSKITSTLRAKYSVWCANTSRTPNITCGIHQYSFQGRVNGINGFVDLNHAYQDYPRIIKEGGFNGYSKGSK